MGFFFFSNGFLLITLSFIKLSLVEYQGYGCPVYSVSQMSCESLQLSQSFTWPLGCFSTALLTDLWWMASAEQSHGFAIFFPF